MEINRTTNTTIKKICLRCILAITLLTFANKAEANPDSLKQIWTNVTLPDSTRFQSIAEYYRKNLFSQPDSIIQLTAYHIELAQQKNSQEQIAIAFNRKAVAFNMKGNSDQALIEMNKSIDIHLSLNDSLSLILAYNNLAKIHIARVEYQESLTYFSKCLAFYQAHNIQSYAHATVLMNIGNIYLDINNYDLAMEYFNKALQLLNNNGLENKVGPLWLDIAKVNLGKKEFEEAIENCKKALKLIKAQDTYYIANCYSFTAKVYQEMNQVDSALLYINKGLQLHQKIGTNLLILKDQIVLASLISIKDSRTATHIGEGVLETAETYEDHLMKTQLYKVLYKCYKKEKNYPLAIVMLEKHNNYSDSLRIEQNKLAVIKKTIQTEYEAKFLNTQFENEQSKSQLQLSQSIKIRTMLFLSSLAILGIGFYLKAKRNIQNKQKEVLLNQVNHLEELETTHQRLVNSDKMASLGQLTAGVAHEINNPVNFISNGVIGLKKTLNEYIESPKDETTKVLVEDMNDMIAAIEDGAQRTSDIVKSLRMFSREDTENYVEVNIIQGLESTFSLLSNKLMHGVFLKKYFDQIEVSIFCFPSQLNQVFMNVLMNAIQAVEGAGTIQVKVEEKEEHVIISISDSGVGISDDKKQKIFEPFYTTKTIQEGTGLGLSITHDIIKKHMGSIEVKDNVPKGTIFIIKLPKREARLIKLHKK